jgi:hypothetical protein
MASRISRQNIIQFIRTELAAQNQQHVPEVQEISHNAFIDRHEKKGAADCSVAPFL